MSEALPYPTIYLKLVDPTQAIGDTNTMSTPETEGKENPHASVSSALAARELPSAVNSKELLDAHFSETGGKVID